MSYEIINRINESDWFNRQEFLRITKDLIETRETNFKERVKIFNIIIQRKEIYNMIKYLYHKERINIHNLT